jgi:aspartyl-tRNA(Asn)/glutamyl-tRNA(Gln) amidotransferase subunit C
MALSADDAARIAALARLDLSRDKLELFAGQFNDILGYMDKLNQVDTQGVEPMYSPADHATVFREDTARGDAGPAREDVLANAPESDGRFFLVPKIF